jgi:hypothetical protein
MGRDDDPTPRQETSMEEPASQTGEPSAAGGEREGTTWETLIEESVSFPTGILRAIGRATMDPTYRALLFEQPDLALSGLHLADDERAQLVAIDRQQFDSVVEGLRMELAGVLAQAAVRDRQILALAKAWAEDIERILPEDDDSPQPPGREGEPSDG